MGLAFAGAAAMLPFAFSMVILFDFMYFAGDLDAPKALVGSTSSHSSNNDMSSCAMALVKLDLSKSTAK